MWFFILLCLIIVLISLSVIFFKIRERKYYRFLIYNSISLENLINLNRKYDFYSPIEKLGYNNTYDNEKFYNSISCEDYLIYQLQYQKSNIQRAIVLISKNREDFVRYGQELSKINTFGEYKRAIRLRKRRLLAMEKKLFEQKKLKPITRFSIPIVLHCSKINGSIYKSKRQTFTAEQITGFIKRLGNKSGSFYNDKQIWDALCRVERGKVSNKMRFSIYKRDGYRCKICGRKDNLEIDHIKPIAKGGKSTYDNLQTLCKSCNKIKGDTY